jgi:spore coat polysaccharide biosynthesis protein SpsF (cytidylyltransferase family)
MSAPVIGIIQARMGSSRVPGKAMLDLAGRPLIWHMIDRMRRVRGVGPLILATTADRRNDPMVAFAEREGLKVFRHPVEDDLAGRIAGAISGVPGDVVLKTGGDCPLIDPAVLQRMVDVALAEGDADFVSNRVQWSYPLGLSADVLSRRAIEWCDRTLTAPEERELFAVYVRDHPDRFKVVPIVNDRDLSHHGWTVDEPADVLFMRDIFDRLYREGEVFGMHDVLAYLEPKSPAEQRA